MSDVWMAPDSFLCVFTATFSLIASSGAGEGLPHPRSRDEKTEVGRVSALRMNMTVGGHEPKPGGPRSKSRVETPARPGPGPVGASDSWGGTQSLAFALQSSCCRSRSIPHAKALSYIKAFERAAPSSQKTLSFQQTCPQPSGLRSLVH